MRCFYAPETRAHDPQFRLTHGRVVTNAERAERATLLQEGLGRLGLTTETPPEAPRAALEAVHTARFLDFLETGWQACRTKGAGRMSEPDAIFDAAVELLGK